jgi:hypothetical protein
MLLDVVDKTNNKYVLPSFTSCATCTFPFHLWMLQAKYDIFAMVVNLIDNSWELTL